MFSKNNNNNNLNVFSIFVLEIWELFNICLEMFKKQCTVLFVRLNLFILYYFDMMSVFLPEYINLFLSSCTFWDRPFKNPTRDPRKSAESNIPFLKFHSALPIYVFLLYIWFTSPPPFLIRRKNGMCALAWPYFWFKFQVTLASRLPCRLNIANLVAIGQRLIRDRWELKQWPLISLIHSN